MRSSQAIRVRKPRAPRQRPGPDGTSERSKFARYFDTPLGRIIAVVTAIAAVVALVGSWPETWWPREVPAVAIGLSTNIENNVHALTMDATAIKGAPPPNGPGGCNSEARQKWARDLGGFPSRRTYDYIVVTALRSNTTVVITDFRAIARKTPGTFKTGLVTCSNELGTGGNYPFIRNVHIEMSEGPKVQFLNDDDQPLDRLTVVLNKGDAAEFQVHALLEEPGSGYEWYGEISMLVNDEVEHLRVPEQGYFRLADLTESAVMWSDTEKPNICIPGRSENAWC
jgi:hypothetical protein